MREYGKVSPQFWIGRTGKALRGQAEVQVLALYLMTSPHANMIGVYHCPIAYMAHETGLSIEGASKALQSLIDANFCTFDAVDEYVFVHQFALHQIGESLAPTDKRCKGVENELSRVPKNQCWQAFRSRYAVPYNLAVDGEGARPIEAPPEPLQSQKQKQKQKQNIDAPSLKSPRGTFLPADWVLPADWRVWAREERPDLDVDAVACMFRDYWIAKPGEGGRKKDWPATWRNWVRNQRPSSVRPQIAATEMQGGFV